MAKNVLIYSDGTGQAGGLAPDQRLSNIYKLYRATRVGPDNSIDPKQQVAFYDPGLGTQPDEGRIRVRLIQSVRKTISAAIGFGITRNIADCYEAILREYRPGDRVYLFGFSRGAYTVRCVAGVMNLCGVPTKTPNGRDLPRRGPELRAIADEAVKCVYEHGAGHDRAKFELEREELARRFRAKYSSEVDGHANVVPYLIGVFDTVAALGAKGAKRVLINLGIAATAIGVAALIALALVQLDLPYLVGFGLVSAVLLGLVFASMAVSSFRMIRDFPRPGTFRWHFAGWSSGFYDRLLDRRVRFGRHALAIDETRADFARVQWGQKGEAPERLPGEPEWLKQIWFAGCHSDIGGSYAENESRLSDIALSWMVDEATSVPHPILIDKSKLNLFPDPSGIQHSEVDAVRDLYPRWISTRWRLSWPEKPRVEALGAPWHPTVLERFGCESVIHHAESKPYRPSILRNDERVRQLYTDERHST